LHFLAQSSFDSRLLSINLADDGKDTPPFTNDHMDYLFRKLMAKDAEMKYSTNDIFNILHEADVQEVKIDWNSNKENENAEKRWVKVEGKNLGMLKDIQFKTAKNTVPVKGFTFTGEKEKPYESEMFHFTL